MCSGFVSSGPAGAANAKEELQPTGWAMLLTAGMRKHLAQLDETVGKYHYRVRLSDLSGERLQDETWAA